MIDQFRYDAVVRFQDGVDHIVLSMLDLNILRLADAVRRVSLYRIS